jgi:hypothetical protein
VSSKYTTTKSPKNTSQHSTNVPDSHLYPSQPYIPDGPLSLPLVPRVYSNSSGYSGAFILISGLNRSLPLEGVGDLGVQGYGATVGGLVALQEITLSCSLTRTVGLSSLILGG